MIISHKYEFIFIAIPKTGTHAIRFALRPYLGLQDEEQVGLFKKSQLSNSVLARLKHGHITAEQSHQLIPNWNQYFKFSFVRNPYDRLVSFAHFFYPENPVMQRHPKLHLKKILLHPPVKKLLWFQPQTNFLYGKDGKLKIDFAGKVERLQYDYEYVCQRTSISSESLKQVNKSSHRDFQDYFDEESATLAYNYYEKDFVNFNYEKDSWKTL